VDSGEGRCDATHHFPGNTEESTMHKLIIASVIALSLPAIGCAGADIATGEEMSNGSGHGQDGDRDRGDDAGDDETRQGGRPETGACDNGGHQASEGSAGGAGGGDCYGGGCNESGSEGGAGGGDCYGDDCDGGGNTGSGGGDQGGETPEATCYVVAGNPTCSSEGLGATLIRIDPVTDGVHSAATAEIDLYTDGVVFDFDSAGEVTAVIVKGGPNALVCTYDRPVYGDADLAAPLNDNSGETYGLSHVDFCLD
jgi:hypothetical protein